MARPRALTGVLVAAAVFGGAAGCGGSEPGPPATSAPITGPSTASVAPPAQPRGDRSRALLIAALGDSITAGAPGWDPDPAIRSELGVAPDPRSQYEFWAQRRLGPGVRFRNCGVSGETTEEIAARLDACARGAGALIVQGGVNDIARGLSVSQAAGNLEAMVRRAKRRGLRVSVAELLPWNNGHPAATPAVARLNRLIAAIARRERVGLLRFHRALEDPRRPGRMRADLTSDGDHPSISGYRRLGEVVRAP